MHRSSPMRNTLLSVVCATGLAACASEVTVVDAASDAPIEPEPRPRPGTDTTTTGSGGGETTEALSSHRACFYEPDPEDPVPCANGYGYGTSDDGACAGCRGAVVEGTFETPLCVGDSIELFEAIWDCLCGADNAYEIPGMTTGCAGACFTECVYGAPLGDECSACIDTTCGGFIDACMADP